MRGLLKHCESLAGSGFQVKQVARQWFNLLYVAQWWECLYLEEGIYKKYHPLFEQNRAIIVTAAPPHNVVLEFARLKSLFLLVAVENPAEHCNLHEREIKFELVWDPGKPATG